MHRLGRVAAVFMLAAGAGLAGCTGTSGGPVEAATGPAGMSATQPGTAPTTSFVPHPLEESAARSLESALISGDDGQVRAALSVPPAQKLDPALTKGLKGLAPIVVDEATFRQVDGQTATVTIRTSGKKPQTWEATLLYEAGTWKLALTSEASS